MIKCIIIKVRLIINTTTVCPVVTYVLCSHKIVIKIKIIIYISTIYLQRKLENVVFVCIVVICLCTKQIIMSDTMGGWNNINTIII